MFKWFYREEGDVGRSESGHDRVWFHQFLRVLVVRAAYEATLRARKLPMNLPSFCRSLFRSISISFYTPHTHRQTHKDKDSSNKRRLCDTGFWIKLKYVILGSVTPLSPSPEARNDSETECVCECVCVSLIFCSARGQRHSSQLYKCFWFSFSRPHTSYTSTPSAALMWAPDWQTRGKKKKIMLSAAHMWTPTCNRTSWGNNTCGDTHTHTHNTIHTFIYRAVSTRNTFLPPQTHAVPRTHMNCTSHRKTHT